MQQILDVSNISGNNIDANNIDLNIIQGRDLKALRLDAQTSCAAIALQLRSKSTKNTENWSNGKGEPRANVFIHYCRFLGFDAAKGLDEVFSCNRQVPSKQQKINLNASHLNTQR